MENLESPPYSTDAPPAFRVRTELLPGDIGTVVYQHGIIYSREWGFDASFEPYVAAPLAQFALSRTERDRLWIAEREGRFAGCIAIVGTSAKEAQLRWFLVDASARGSGLGKWLLHEAIAFARACGYRSIVLWTVSALSTATHLYRSAGFRKVGEKPGYWGVPVIEEKYELAFA